MRKSEESSMGTTDTQLMVNNSLFIALSCKWLFIEWTIRLMKILRGFTFKRIKSRLIPIRNCCCCYQSPTCGVLFYLWRLWGSILRNSLIAFALNTPYKSHILALFDFYNPGHWIDGRRRRRRRHTASRNDYWVKVPLEIPLNDNN